MRSLWMIAGLTTALFAQRPEIRFRVEPLTDTAGPPAGRPAEFGIVNRVRYRVARRTGTLTVERESITPPDPQGGTRARPIAAPGAPWTAESVPSPSGTQEIGRASCR